MIQPVRRRTLFNMMRRGDTLDHTEAEFCVFVKAKITSHS